MFCLCHYGPALLTFWFQTDLGREKSTSYLKIQVGKTFFTMATLYVQLLCPDWSKFDRWAPAEDYAASWNLFTLTAEADILLCQLVIFLTAFFHWMCKMKYSCYQELSRVFCHLWPVCLLGFWLRNASLVKVGNPISDNLRSGPIWAVLIFVSPCPPECYLRAQFMRQVNYARL